MTHTTLLTACLLALSVLPLGVHAQPPAADSGVAIEGPIGARAELDDSDPDDLAKNPEAGINELSPLIVEKLDARQLESYLRYREKMRASAHGSADKGFVAILVPLFFFLCVAVVVGGALYFRSRQNLQRHLTLRLMIEKGAEIPPELLTPPVKPRSDLRKGVVLLAGGIGATIFFALVKTGDAGGVWSLGLIPALIGLGYLIVWLIEVGRQEASREQASQQEGTE